MKIHFFIIKTKHMKRQLTLVLLGMAMLFCIRGQGQSIAPFILNASGGSYDNPGSYTRFEWSFGELVLTDTYTSTNGALILTQGLLQPCTDKVVKDPEILLFSTNEWKIFPNVTRGPFELDFFLNIPGHMDLQMTDAMGRVISRRSFAYHCCERIERYDISNLANGIYFINATFTPGGHGDIELSLRTRRQGTFRIVKAR
jgi:hypothetical protein